VIALTDEELCALDGGPGAEQVAPSPWLDAQDDAARRIACEVAVRGLTARNLIAVSASPAGDKFAEIHPELKTTLDMRRSSRSIVVAQRQSPTGSHTRVLYRHDETVLEEDVTPGGLHTFTVLLCTPAAARLAALADPAGAARDHPASQPRTLPLTAIADGAPIAGTEGVRSVTAIGLVTRDTAGEPCERRVAVYALADRVLTTEPVPHGEQPGDQNRAMLVVTEVSSGQLLQRIDELLTTPAGAQS
jgi:hypothetical protein